MSNLGYLFAAFAAIWAVLFGYVLVLTGRTKRLQRELDDLKASLPGKP
jgi:CcmD family protein